MSWSFATCSSPLVYAISSGLQSESVNVEAESSRKRKRYALLGGALWSDQITPIIPLNATTAFTEPVSLAPLPRHPKVTADFQASQPEGPVRLDALPAPVVPS